MSDYNAFVNVSGGMSDEFSKKMKEWNELQTTKRFSASQRGGIARFIPFFISLIWKLQTSKDCF